MSTAHGYVSIRPLGPSSLAVSGNGRSEASRARVFYLAQEGGTAGLDGLNLGEVDGLAAEAGGKLGNVKEDAAGGVDGAERRAGHAADASLAGANRLLQGAVLLGVVAVGAEAGVAGRGAVGRGAEALGQLARGRGRVRLGAVVDGSCRRDGNVSEPPAEEKLGVKKGAQSETYKEWSEDR